MRDDPVLGNSSSESYLYVPVSYGLSAVHIHMHPQRRKKGASCSSMCGITRVRRCSRDLSVYVSIYSTDHGWARSCPVRHMGAQLRSQHCMHVNVIVFSPGCDAKWMLGYAWLKLEWQHAAFLVQLNPCMFHYPAVIFAVGGPCCRPHISRVPWCNRCCCRTEECYPSFAPLGPGCSCNWQLVRN